MVQVILKESTICIHGMIQPAADWGTAGREDSIIDWQFGRVVWYAYEQEVADIPRLHHTSDVRAHVQKVLA